MVPVDGPHHAHEGCGRARVAGGVCVLAAIRARTIIPLPPPLHLPELVFVSGARLVPEIVVSGTLMGREFGVCVCGLEGVPVLPEDGFRHPSAARSCLACASPRRWPTRWMPRRG